MLLIDGKEFNIVKSEVILGKFTVNGIPGYDVGIKLEFFNDSGEKGYINLDVGYELENDIIYFLNREYKGINLEGDNDYIMFEIFDTIKFLDSEIESEIVVSIKDMEDDSIYISFKVDDELIKVDYDGKIKFIEK